MGITKQDTRDSAAEVRPDRLWAVIIVVGLVVMMAVNVAFIYIAVTGADAVDPAYVEGER